MVKVVLAHYQYRLYVYSFTHKPVLDLERCQHSEKWLCFLNFRLLPAILDIRLTIVSSAVGRGRVHSANSVKTVAPC